MPSLLYDYKYHPISLYTMISASSHNAAYKFLKSSLLKDGQKDWHFVIWFMAATGTRVSELLQIKAEHVQAGHIDLYTKGGKVRRIYSPRTLQKKALLWLTERQISSGYIFLNRFGKRITTRGIAMQLKYFLCSNDDS